MVITIFLYIFIVAVILKLLADAYYVAVSYDELHQEIDYKVDKNVNILILIPVLREQHIIEKTLEHFKTLELENITLKIVIAGTSREKKSLAKDDVSTKDVVNLWIAENTTENAISYEYVEVIEEKGDRASQLNFAVKNISEKFSPSIIGVYDADSLPDRMTLLEVAANYNSNPDTILQQPVHFITAANRMSRQGKNPLLVANAMYQTDWTVIRELSRWSSHFKFTKRYSGKIYMRNDYLIGHGEFIPYEIYKKYEFPEMEVTDGIQLGYRISMGGEKIKPLHTFCVDDVPQEVGQLIHQHKRWFGGCNRLYQAYSWSKNNTGRASFIQVIDGYWSQLSWAYAAVCALIALSFAVFKALNGSNVFLIVIVCLLMLYCYLVPWVSQKVIGVKAEIRFIDWLCMPLAIALKGIGPNLYLIERFGSILFNKEMQYKKVER